MVLACGIWAATTTCGDQWPPQAFKFFGDPFVVLQRELLSAGHAFALDGPLLRGASV
jgi:hypothetical protein